LVEIQFRHAAENLFSQEFGLSRIDIPSFTHCLEVCAEYRSFKTERALLFMEHENDTSSMTLLDRVAGVDLPPFKLESDDNKIIIIDVTSNPRDLAEKVRNHNKSEGIFKDLYGDENEYIKLVLFADLAVNADFVRENYGSGLDPLEPFSVGLVEGLEVIAAMDASDRPRWVSHSELLLAGVVLEKTPLPTWKGRE
jgi:hypothetical protein